MQLHHQRAHPNTSDNRWKLHSWISLPILQASPSKSLPFPEIIYWIITLERNLVKLATFSPNFHLLNACVLRISLLILANASIWRKDILNTEKIWIRVYFYSKVITELKKKHRKAVSKPLAPMATCHKMWVAAFYPANSCPASGDRFGVPCIKMEPHEFCPREVGQYAIVYIHPQSLLH